MAAMNSGAPLEAGEFGGAADTPADEAGATFGFKRHAISSHPR
jgi:hypothetical protein